MSLACGGLNYIFVISTLFYYVILSCHFERSWEIPQIEIGYYFQRDLSTHYVWLRWHLVGELFFSSITSTLLVHVISSEVEQNERMEKFSCFTTMLKLPNKKNPIARILTIFFHVNFFVPVQVSKLPFKFNNSSDINFTHSQYFSAIDSNFSIHAFPKRISINIIWKAS